MFVIWIADEFENMTGSTQQPANTSKQSEPTHEAIFFGPRSHINYNGYNQ